MLCVLVKNNKNKRMTMREYEYRAQHTAQSTTQPSTSKQGSKQTKINLYYMYS